MARNSPAAFSDAAIERLANWVNPSEISVQRLNYLDGLRGLACLQVMFLHILAGFFPGFVESPKTVHTLESWVQHSPLFFLYDGFAGVFIFLLLSGYVLTRAFEKPGASVLRLTEARIVRLWVPTAAFGIFSLGLLIVFPSSHIAMGHLVHSGFLENLWTVDLNLSDLLQEIFVNPLFIGYQNSPFKAIVQVLYPHIIESGAGLDPPVWTMSVELQGSVLVLAMVCIRRNHAVLWAVANVVGMVMLPVLYVCFLVGHVAAAVHLAERPVIGGRVGSTLMLLLVVAGWLVAWRTRIGPRVLAGTAMIFLGVIQCLPLRRLLAKPPLRNLGAISFTIYLVHWAVLFGPGAWLALKLVPLIGLNPSRIIVAVLIAVGVPWLSRKLLVVDEIAMHLSHRARAGWTTATAQQRGGVPSTPAAVESPVAHSDAPVRALTG